MTCVGVTAREHCALRPGVSARLALSTRVKPEGHVESETGVEPAVTQVRVMKQRTHDPRVLSPSYPARVGLRTSTSS